MIRFQISIVSDFLPSFRIFNQPRKIWRSFIIFLDRTGGGGRRVELEDSMARPSHPSGRLFEYTIQNSLPLDIYKIILNYPNWSSINSRIEVSWSPSSQVYIRNIRAVQPHFELYSGADSQSFIHSARQFVTRIYIIFWTESQSLKWIRNVSHWDSSSIPSVFHV